MPPRLAIPTISDAGIRGLLLLGLSRHDPNYIDAYYGPEAFVIT